MILKEDYFNDLNLTDDDIESSDDNYNTDTDDYDYANGKEYYKAMSSKYSHYIVLNIETYNNPTDSVLWTNKVPRMLKKLFYLFDSYEIKYSKPVVSEEDYNLKDFIKIEFKGCKFFDFHEYKLITNHRTLNAALRTIKTLEHRMGVLLFFNPPKT